VSAVLGSRKPTISATLSAKMNLRESMNFAGATVQETSKAMELSARSQRQLEEAGDLRRCARVARSGAFCGTPSAPKAITLKVAACARQTVQRAWETRASSALNQAIPGRILTL